MAANDLGIRVTQRPFVCSGCGGDFVQVVATVPFPFYGAREIFDAVRCDDCEATKREREVTRGGN